MTWVRIHPYLTNWPDGCPPPVFTISADQPGSVVIELAWDPQALVAPADYPDPLRYFTTALGGGAVAAEPITLSGASVDWAIPTPLWSAYVAEAAKIFTSPAGTTFSGNLYYRVRITPNGVGTTAIWPSDEVLGSPAAAAAPHIGILTASTHNAAPIPDPAALAAAGGTAASPTQWADSVSWCWSKLPDADDTRKSLADVFGHPAFHASEVADRGQLLALWMLAGPSRQRLTDLLDLMTTGGAADVPAIGSRSTAGTALVPTLLALTGIVMHPELSGVLSREQLLDDVITEILDPNGQSDLGVAGTCSVTAPQAWLIGAKPAEYARLQTGLLSAAGGATLADGSVLTVPPGAFRAIPEASPLGPNVFLARTNAELAFASALLHRVSPALFIPDPSAVQANAALQAAANTGMAIEDAAAALSALFGSAVAPRNVSWPPRPNELTWQAEQDAVRDSLLAVLAQRRSALVHLFWSAPPAGDTSRTHAVLALRQEGGTVVIRNSQYPGATPPAFAVAGGTADLPPRSYRNPAKALESLTTDDLGAWILGYLAPATAIS